MRDDVSGRWIVNGRCARAALSPFAADSNTLGKQLRVLQGKWVVHSFQLYIRFVMTGSTAVRWSAET
jgi:hypothetical protein